MLCFFQVSYPGLFPLAPGDRLAVSEAREIPSIRLEEASKDKLYTVGRFSHHLPPTRYLPPQPWSTQMHRPGKTLGQPSGSTGYSQMLTVRKEEDSFALLSHRILVKWLSASKNDTFFCLR